ncbi:hypothetical protein R1sor_020831 [Riccia sorocarpa]|uniref:MLO-like protein n=1 Tax=Riccia sorocarpa TaxID=122646 RepID=A0ABD3GIN5_9MARC
MTPQESNLDPDATLEHTPTWAVGIVCIVFVALSILLETLLKHLSRYLERTNQKPLQETLHRMREDLMMLGFLSLFLTASRNSLTRICIPKAVTNYMLPCSSTASLTGHELLTVNQAYPPETSCSSGKVPLMSVESIHQLHIFIFIMAMVHVFYSCLTMILARSQIKGWGSWEEEYLQHDAVRDSFKISRQNSFVTDRVSHPWTSKAWYQWIDAFARQFYSPVKHSDYLSLRLGFVKNHNVGQKFNFLKYVMQTLEEDFKVIVGISASLWIFVIVFMLLNIYGWYTYFWLAFLPLLLLLVVGTKLQHIMTQLAIEIANSSTIIGEPIKPRDELFWFSRPHLMLHLIHFILFQNSFELAYFFWLWVTYGMDSCFLTNRAFVYARVVIGFLSQVLCSHATLPLYALVTQMGSSYKRAIFKPVIEHALHGWHQKAMENRKKRLKGDTQIIPDKNGNPSGGDSLSSPEVKKACDFKVFERVKSRFAPQNDRVIPQVDRELDGSSSRSEDCFLPSKPDDNSDSDSTPPRFPGIPGQSLHTVIEVVVKQETDQVKHQMTQTTRQGHRLMSMRSI